MATMRGGLTTLAAVLAALAPAAPVEARADEGEKTAAAERCAISYEQIIWSSQAPEIISGLDQILSQNRGQRLIQSYGLNGPMIEMAAMGTTANPLIEPLHTYLDSGEPTLVEGAIKSLASCDRIYGFTPAIAQKRAPATPSASASPQTTHRQCATNYFTLALLAPHAQGILRPRIRQAAAADAGREMTDEAIRDRLIGDARKRGQAIQGGQEKPDALLADVHACDAKYGHAPVKLQ